jgi:hypothetical protein
MTAALAHRRTVAALTSDEHIRAVLAEAEDVEAAIEALVREIEGALGRALGPVAEAKVGHVVYALAGVSEGVADPLVLGLLQEHLLDDSDAADALDSLLASRASAIYEAWGVGAGDEDASPWAAMLAEERPEPEARPAWGEMLAEDAPEDEPSGWGEVLAGSEDRDWRP